jgi:hypothetical protein
MQPRPIGRVSGRLCVAAATPDESGDSPNDFFELFEVIAVDLVPRMG